MALSRVAGQMLKSNLERDGANLAVDTDLLYIDVVNNRVGINQATPTVALEVSGNILANNLSVVANVGAGNINSTDQIVATGNITGGNIDTGGLVLATGNITGGNINSDARIYGVTGYFTGNVDVLGNLNATIGVVYANSGIFYGNSVTGNNAAFAGVPGFTQLGSNVVMQFAGNVNSYSQLNFENINNGTLATTDFILTADNGSDTTYFVDLGMSSSNHNDPGFFGDLASSNNDAYLYVVASDATGPSVPGSEIGNLILGSTNGVVKTFVGNTAQANVITVASSTGFEVFGNIAVSGNINVANINTTDVIASNSVVTPVVTSTANLTISSASAGNITVDPDSSGTFVIAGTNGFVMPVGNTAQRPSPASPGTLRFNSEYARIEYYDGTEWDVVAGGITNQTISTADGVIDTFVLDRESTTAAVLVMLNGIVQIPVSSYSVTGNSLVFTQAPAVSDIIDIRFL